MNAFTRFFLHHWSRRALTSCWNRFEQHIHKGFRPEIFVLNNHSLNDFLVRSREDISKRSARIVWRFILLTLYVQWFCLGHVRWLDARHWSFDFVDSSVHRMFVFVDRLLTDWTDSRSTVVSTSPIDWTRDWPRPRDSLRMDPQFGTSFQWRHSPSR